MAKTKLPALKNIPPKTDRELKIALDSIKEALEVRLGQRGDPLDRAVTLRELEDSGIVKVKNKKLGVTGGITTPPGGGGITTPPPAPSTLEASAAFTTITLSWTKASYGNHAYSEVWRSQANDLGGAVRVATTNAFVYTDEVGYNSEQYYWVRYVSATDVVGPWNDVEGTSATTAADVGTVMQQLSEELANLPGFTNLQNDMQVVVDGNTSSLASALGTLDTAVDTAQTAANSAASDAATAQTAANNAQSTANSASSAAAAAQSTANSAATAASTAATASTRVIKSTSAPTQRDDGSAIQAHDIWVDTDDNNQVYARNSSNNGWEKSRDATLVSTVGSTSFTGTTLTGAMASAQSSIITINSTNTSQGTAITNLENTVNDSSTGVAATASALSTLTTRVTNTENATTTNTSDITALENTVNDSSTGVSALNSALSSLSSTVTAQGNSITTNATDITALENTVNDSSTGVAANSSAIGTLQSTVTTQGNSITTNASDITALENTVNDSSTGVAATSSALSSLTSTVTTQGNSISTNSSNITALQNTVNDSSSGVAALNTAVSGLQSTVTTQGNNITTNATDITALESALTGYTGSNAVSTAISGLQSQITANDGDITSNANSITSLNTSLNTLDTLVDTKGRTFAQDDVPTSTAIGDLWIDTNDSNKLYVSEAVGADQVTSGEWVLVRDTGIAANSSAISTLQSTTSTQGNSITTNASNITSLQNALSGYTGSGAVSTALSSLQSQITANDGDISSTSSSLTNLTNTVNTINGDYATGTALTALTSRVSTNEGDITSINSDITTLNSSLSTLDTLVDTKARTFVGSSAPTATAVGDLWINTSSNENKLYRAEAVGADQITSGEWVLVRDSGIATNASAISSLNSTVTSQGSTITSQSSSITALQNALSGYTSSGAVSTAISGLDSRITANDGDITAINSDITSLESTVNTINGDYATATALNSLSTTVTTQGNSISSNASNISNLTTSVGNNSSSVTSLQQAIANGTSAQAAYGVAVNANGAVAGMYLMVDSSGNEQNNTSTSNIIFEANQVTIRNPHGSNVTPFTVLTSTDSNGNPAGVYIDTAFIKDAAISAAQIGTVNADTITTGDMSAARITSGTMDAARISGGVIQSTDLSTNGSTTIHGGNIITNTISANAINASFIQASDLGASGSTTIDGSRITTGQISADRIDVEDLILPTINKKVTGGVIGGFANNDMRLAQVGEIGTERGIYMGYVRVFGGSGQVKTLSIAIGDGTYSSSGSGTQLSGAADAYTNGPTNTTLPMLDTGGIQYHSNRAEAWAGIGRFENTYAVAQISVTFKKISANTIPTRLYIHAQGDGGTRYLSSVEYSFQRLALNQPEQFTFNDVTNNMQFNTVMYSNTITLAGSGFISGTATLTGHNTRAMSINGGSYQQTPATVSVGDTIRLKVTSGSLQNGVTRSATLNIQGVTETFSVTNQGSFGGM